MDTSRGHELSYFWICGLRDLLSRGMCGLRDLLFLQAGGLRDLDTLVLGRLLSSLDFCFLLVLASLPDFSVSTHLTARVWDGLESG